MTNFISGKLGNKGEIPLSRGGAEGDGVVSKLVNATETPPPANAGYSSVEENLSEVVVQDGEGAVVGGERFACGDQEVSATRELFGDHLGFVPTSSLRFSLEAEAVFEAGRELWRYYHEKCDDASVGRFGGGDGASPLRGVYNANA